MKISFVKCVESDSAEQLKIQKSAFMPLYEKYGDEESPANMTLEEMKGKIENPRGQYLAIYCEQELAGGIYAYPIDDSGEVMYLCSVYIKPELQGKCLAQAAIKHMEIFNPKCTKWVLDVPEHEEKNIHIYEKMGFVRTDECEKINDRLTIRTYIKNYCL